MLWFLAIYDAETTTRKIREYGLQVELNPFIVWLGKRIGVTAGVFTGICLPTALCSTLGWYNSNVLAFVLGVRFTLFLFQKRADYIMETKSTFKMPPVDTFTPEDSAHDVRRMDSATNDLVGPVVVGGLACADNFRWVGALQAGTTEPYAYGTDKFKADDGDEDDTNKVLVNW